MIELTVKIQVPATNTNEAEKWLEELAENELFEFEVIKTEKV